MAIERNELKRKIIVYAIAYNTKKVFSKKIVTKNNTLFTGDNRWLLVRMEPIFITVFPW